LIANPKPAPKLHGIPMEELLALLMLSTVCGEIAS
jgi:hypothetical protein